MQRENTHRPFDGSRLILLIITSHIQIILIHHLSHRGSGKSAHSRGLPVLQPPNQPFQTPISSAPFSRDISLRALRIASSSTFFIVPDTFITRNTHDRIFPAPAGAPFFIPPLLKSGTCDIYVRAVQTRRNDARGHRMIAVEVAGDKYLTLTPPAPTPPSRPTPQSPKISATSSLTIFASKAGVSASDVGECIRSWASACEGNFVLLVEEVGQEERSG